MPAPRRALAIAAGLSATTSFVVVPLLTAPLLTSASAAPGDGLVISEVYGGGGNLGGTFRQDFVELHNRTTVPVDLTGLSLQYRSAGGTAAAAVMTALPARTLAPGARFLVGAATGSDTSQQALPTPDATATTAMSGTAGQVFLVRGTTAITPAPVGTTDTRLVDAVGWGSTATWFEGSAPAPGTTNPTSVARAPEGTDTDDNQRDFRTGAPTPQSSGGTGPAPDPGVPLLAIAEVQGTGGSTAYAGRRVAVQGVVTAAYPTGGYRGFFLQTAGTGTGADATPGASDALFVFAGGAAVPAVGEHLRVEGTAGEFGGLTQLSGALEVTRLAEPAAVSPRATTLPVLADREASEGELLLPRGPFTVTNTFTTNRFAEVGLAAGTTPLVQPTEVADAQDTAAVAAVVADNADRGVVLDDGASVDFLAAANQGTPLPWLTRADGTPRPVRVGAPVSFLEPVVLDFRNGTWKLQPTSQLTSDEPLPVAIADTRTPAPREVGGDVRLATFNVLNYFSTTGEDFEATGGTCTYFRDRAGDEVTVNRCDPDGPRGAAEQEDLERQEAKIVAAVNRLGAGIVSLEEIENSAKFGLDRDAALAELTEALNAALPAGADPWAFVPSAPRGELPPLERQDVIRTAFLYKPALVEPFGPSDVLDDPAFVNARQPLAQAFLPAGGHPSTAFAVIVNHFKSKGSGVDDGTGQGLANPDRVAQAEALAAFADEFAAGVGKQGTERVFLTGDLNAYTEEDPVQVLEAAGYTVLESDEAGDETYSFSGLSGSLDHVLASPAALEMVTGVDVWQINSGESVAFEYSRRNYHVTDFYAPDPYRSSDHDPEVVGLRFPVRQR